MISNLQVTLCEDESNRRVRSSGKPVRRKGSVGMSKYFRIDSQSDRSGSIATHVLELELPDQVDTAEFDRINESVLGALEGKTNGVWVVDLAGVNYMGSAMLGLIVNIRQQIKNLQGQLVLCALSPRLLQIFRTCCMERLFTIARTRDEALRMCGVKSTRVIAGR